MRESLRKPESIGWILLGAAMVASVALLFWLQRDLAFADDSFNWLQLTGLGSGSVLLEPYGGHLIFTPLLIFKAVVETAGASYTAYGVVQVAMLLALSTLIYIYGRRRVGPLLALPAAVIILFLGSAWNVMLQPMLGIQFMAALVPGLAGLLALEREDRKGDIAACILFTLASWGFEMGFAFIVGGAVSILLRGDRWKRIWIVAVPLVIYLIWKAWSSKYGGSSGLQLSNVLWIPAYFIDSIGVIAVSLFGLYYWVGHGQLTNIKLTGWNISNFTEGIVIAIFAGLAFFFAVRRLVRRGPLPATFWVALAILVTLWLEQALALAPTRTPGETRYIFPGAVVSLMFVMELARGVRTTRWSLLVAAALLLAAVVGSGARFKEGRDVLTQYSPPANAAMTAMILGGDNIRPDFNAALDAPSAFPSGLLAYIGSQPIQEIAAKYGSPAFSVAGLEAQPESVRRTADVVSAFGLEVHTVPAGAAGAACKPKPGASDTLTLPRGGAILVAAHQSELFARRFAGQFVISVGDVGPGEAMELAIPGDEAARPWRVQAPDSGGLTACPL
jgi:hypothetical protein